MPVKPKVTIVLTIEVVDWVAVTVVDPEVSAILVEPTDKVTVGAVSSSIMVTVCCCTPLSVALVTPVMSIITVSLPSKIKSFIEARVMDADN